ncbi:hypothetical protein OC846_004275 [Tilletia horrida]|uniref:AB hydrolase-1 domain-containing protein n=1 Tax=Tilletia horrida TaxID=155126 RepID=A0AAN6GP04_9BASI|nr:hypothetical protein OC846_004275 [Tilletia horrida]
MSEKQLPLGTLEAGVHHANVGGLRHGKFSFIRLLVLLAVLTTYTWLKSPELPVRLLSRIIDHQPASPSGDPFHFVSCYPGGDAASSHWKCGYLDVPLDYTNASDHRKARLAIVMYQVGKKKSKDTIVINPGGPGGSGTYYALRAGETLSKNYTDSTMDILGFDPRGVNMSTPSLSCFSQNAYRDRWSALTSQFPETSKNPLEHMRLTDTYASATWKACEEKFGDTVRFLSTAFVVRDVDKIREALGEELLNAYMVSYGTNIGTTYSQMFPDRVGRMLLDGMDPIDHARTVEGWGQSGEVADPQDDFTQALGDIEKGFVEGVLGECVRAGPEACALARENQSVSDLKDEMYAVFDRLKKHPVAATHPELGPGVVVYEMVDLIIYEALYNSASWPMLAKMLAGLRDGNGTLALEMTSWEFDPAAKVSSYVPGWLGVKQPTTSSEELTNHVVCSDSYDSPRHSLRWWEELQEKMVKRSPLGGSINWRYVISCKSFSVDVAEVYRGGYNHTLKNPILIIGETHDPATPLRGSQHIHKIMGAGNSHLIQHHGYGHSSRDRSANCTERIKRDLFLYGKLPEEDVTDCYADTKPYPPPKASGQVHTAEQPAEFTMSDWKELSYFARRRMAA